jgi:hypothetical protein
MRPSLGIFDLEDPVSALYFGQFILGCHSHFASVEQMSKHREARNLCWRLDHIHHDSLLSQSGSPVETWLQNLPSTANAGYVLYSHDVWTQLMIVDYHLAHRSFIPYAHRRPV